MQEFLGTEPILSLIRKMALPSIISILAYNIYNITDTIFIAKGVGTEAAGGIIGIVSTVRIFICCDIYSGKWGGIHYFACSGRKKLQKSGKDSGKYICDILYNSNSDHNIRIDISGSASPYDRSHRNFVTLCEKLYKNYSFGNRDLYRIF